MKNNEGSIFEFPWKALATLLMLAILLVSLPLDTIAQGLAEAWESTTSDPSMASPDETIDAEMKPESENSTGQGEETQPDALYEENGRREESAKHFRMTDGSYVAVQYPVPVHVPDENGAWADIDNTLIEKDAVYTTANGRVQFAAKASDAEKLFALRDGAYGISFAPNGASEMSRGEIINTKTEFNESATNLEKFTTLDRLTSRVLYTDILNDVDVEYIVNSLNVKENIIVKERQESL